MHALRKKSQCWCQGLLGRYGFYAILVCVFLLTINIAYAEDASGVVIITNKSSQVESLSLLEIRRLYLGFSINNNYVGNPVINRTNEKLYANFLKNVMHMTEEGYKRKIVRRVFRYGSDYVAELHSLDAINQHLKENANDVVFVESKDVSHMDDVKIVMRLW